jgi:toxin YoeB
MAARIIWSALALQQKKEIFDFWNERNKSKVYSRKLNKLINDAAELILTHPKLGRKTDFQDVRLKIVRDYWLAYRVKQDRIQILTI